MSDDKRKARLGVFIGAVFGIGIVVGIAAPALIAVVIASSIVTVFYLRNNKLI